MIVVELAFRETPDRMAARPAHRQQLARLHQAGTLLVAGPWDDDSGALLVFDCGRDELHSILSTDPYYCTDGVTVAAVRGLLPVVGSPSS